jgi:hypothetical protein
MELADFSQEAYPKVPLNTSYGDIFDISDVLWLFEALKVHRE